MVELHAGQRHQSAQRRPRRLVAQPRERHAAAARAVAQRGEEAREARGTRAPGVDRVVARLVEEIVVDAAHGREERRGRQRGDSVPGHRRRLFIARRAERGRQRVERPEEHLAAAAVGCERTAEHELDARGEQIAGRAADGVRRQYAGARGVGVARALRVRVEEGALEHRVDLGRLRRRPRREWIAGAAARRRVGEGEAPVAPPANGRLALRRRRVRLPLLHNRREQRRCCGYGGRRDELRQPLVFEPHLLAQREREEDAGALVLLGADGHL